jgi:nicotinamidase-related amidase
LNTALLVIDMQRSLLDEGPWNSSTVLERILHLVTLARSKAAPIAFIKDRRVKPDQRLDNSLVPSETDGVIEKNFCDSFLNTPLEAWLNERAIHRLVVVGMQTDYCIDTTCRRAASLGFAVDLVKDAHTTFQHEFLTGAQIVNHHNRVLRDFRAGEGSVRTISSTEVCFA